MRVFEWATSYGYTICEARLPTENEKQGYADWYKSRMIIGVKGGNVDLTEFRSTDIQDVFGDRKATHSFLGCDNMVWILQPDDEAKIMAIETARKAAKMAKADAEKKAAEDRAAAIVAKARETGADQVKDRFMASCDGSVTECSNDWVQIMVRPDGSTYQRRTHTH